MRFQVVATATRMPLLRFPRFWLKKAIFKTIRQQTIIFTESNRLIRCVIVSSPRPFILLCIYEYETLNLLAHIWRKTTVKCFYLCAWLAGLPEENMTSGVPIHLCILKLSTIHLWDHPSTACVALVPTCCDYLFFLQYWEPTHNIIVNLF